MMVKNKILVFFIVCVILSHCTKAEESKCSGANEEYICGTKCPKTCTNLDIAIKCLSGCDEGCFCKEDYVRNEETGECVEPSHCPTCGRNETYKARGFDCQTCSNYQIVRCALLNEYRCYCLPGYVRYDKGTCVNTTDCPETGRYRRSSPEN